MVFPMIVPARTQLLSSVFAVFVRWMGVVVIHPRLSSNFGQPQIKANKQTKQSKAEQNSE